MAEGNKNWYVLRAISGKEAKVKEYIETDIKLRGLTDKVSQVLIPTEKVVQVRNGKRIVKERNYLPGYVLVEAELVGEIAYLLRNTPNVLGFLGGMDSPTPIRQSEINRILGTVDELQETADDNALEFALGEVVKVNAGPFQGFNGTIEEINTEKKKLKVMVKIFGRSTPVELGYMQVDKE
ncbi:MAG: transcription termination/antitermination factor NusG [Bacteroidaceae bacterium]|nr:transcription termination/antitermination factor NusG [Bacteroidales bacterium]MBQ3188475.1 transcription termination/antitermination factor NusG [Bacteroidaceae bacterium]